MPTFAPHASTPVAAPGQPHARRIDRLRIRHLRLLEWIANTGSLSAAAQQLQVSQPGATKMLQELEAAFGCSLIERTTRGGQLSKAGSFALARLRIALGALDTAAAGLTARPEVPLVRIGMLPLVAVSALPAMVAALDRDGTLPRITIREETVEGLLQLLLDGKLDCAISRLEAGLKAEGVARFKITRLWEDGLAIAAAPNHPLTRQRKLSIDMLQAACWALPPRSANTRLQFDQWFLEAGMMPPVPHIESLSFHTNLSLAATGAVLAVAPESAVRQYEARGMVRELRLEQPMPRGHVFFVTLNEPSSLDGIEVIMRALQTFALARK